ncbi:MAG: hypothetical protein HYY84_06720 [Deltaproteobacteria bacterium]|nr:hypothetical protein [Deltaproteobacteria bacterium]
MRHSAFLFGALLVAANAGDVRAHASPPPPPAPAPASASATACVAFGPERFERQRRHERWESRVFARKNPNGVFTLVAETTNIHAARLTLNGVALLAPRDFEGRGDRPCPKHRHHCRCKKPRPCTRGDLNPQRGHHNPERFLFRCAVALAGTNTLRVKLKGKPGSSLTTIIEDADRTPPSISITSPQNGATVSATPIRVLGTVDDASATVSVTAAAPVPANATVSASVFFASVPLAEGSNTVTAIARDTCGNEGRAVVTVTLCTPRTCADAGATCGTIFDGCGGTQNCGACTVPETCGGDGVANRCGCSPDNVAACSGKDCGDVTNNCAQTVSCGTCSAPKTCGGAGSPNVCGLPGPPLPPDPATVAPPVAPAVTTTVAASTEFLYTGATAIQTGVDAGTIEPIRAAVIRGRVVARDGTTSVPGATVTIVGHPELGQTLTRADGAFDLAVNGNASLIVRVEKPGFLSADHPAAPVAQDFTVLADIVLVALDSAATPVDLAAPTMQVARASAVTDESGTRRATVLIPAATTATIVHPDGTTTTPAQLTIRATEITVGPSGPAAMPAPLPATTGYTYAIEFTADEALAAGATTVRFSQPLIHYVDNFLNFPVGIAVPTGYYDRALGVWIASDNGRIIRVLSIAAGLANLDINGTGTAATPTALATLGVTDDERAKLATLYAPGQSVWRVPIPHFTTWDCNWTSGPPLDATPPREEAPGTTLASDVDMCAGGSTAVGGAGGTASSSSTSVINQTQAVNHTTTVAGAGTSMTYQSDRAPGRASSRAITIPVSESSSPPASLARIDVEVSVAGRSYKSSLPPTSGQRHTVVWDGLDVYGRVVQGAQTATVTINYAYPASYADPGDLRRAFGFRGNGFEFAPARNEFVFSQSYRVPLGGSIDPRDTGLGGFTFAMHHSYNPISRVVYLGNGREQRASQRLPGTIETIAGNGSPGELLYAPLTTSAFSAVGAPSGLVYDSVGNLHISDTVARLTRVLRSNDTLTTSTGWFAYRQRFVQANFMQPGGLALSPGGDLVIADSRNSWVLRVLSDGWIYPWLGQALLSDISTVVPCTIPVGENVARGGFAGDNELEVAQFYAWLCGPRDVWFDSEGSLFIADTFNHRIRKLTPDGTIRTIAGNGWQGFSGDVDPYETDPIMMMFNGIATMASLNTPSGVSVDRAGNVYIADTGNHRIRKVTPDGRIRTVAGTYGAGFSGDDGPARFASLSSPRDVVARDDGSFFIADTGNHRVRRVGSDGIITTVAGTGSAGFGGDREPARLAQLNAPVAIALDPTGRLTIADTGNNRVRRVEPSYPGFTNAAITIASEDGSELFLFDKAGRHLRTIDSTTGVVVWDFVYTSSGALASVTDRDGLVTRIERDAAGVATAVVAPHGQRTEFAYDANGYLARIVDPAGATQTFTYDPGGLAAQVTDARGGVYRFTYDAWGRLSRVDDPVGAATQFSGFEFGFDSQSNVRTAEGRLSTFSATKKPSGLDFYNFTDFDGTMTVTNERRGESGTETAPDGTVTAWTYGPDPRFKMQSPIASGSVRTPSGLTLAVSTSRAATLIDPSDLTSVAAASETVAVNGRAYVAAFSSSPTKQVVETSPSGRRVTRGLDALDRVTLEEVPGITPWEYAYDAEGRVVAVTQGARMASLAYNAAGFLSSVVDPLGRSWGYSYDAVGRVTKEVLPDLREVRYTYDGNGNVTSVTPPFRPAHNFSYTPFDLESEYAPPPVVTPSATTYSYNLDRQLTHVTRPDGQVIDVGYDTGGRLASVAQARGTIAFTYDTAGRPATATATAPATAPESVSFAYDGFLLTSATATGSAPGVVAYSYDNDFRVTSISVNGAAIAYSYDADSLLTQAGALTLTRDPQNGFIRSTTVGSIATSYTYDSYGDLASIAAPNFSVTYSRDSLGRITRKSETLNSQLSTLDYSYDSAGRLASGGGGTYTYDGNGNRLPGVYDDQDRLLSFGTATYTYHANGDLSSKTNPTGTTSYTYDALGNLVTATLPDATRIDYAIDGLNRRTAKRVNGVVTQGFLYESQLRIAAELDSAGAVVSRFVYATQANVPDLMVKGGATYRLLHDHLGSVRLVVNTATGTIAQRLDYDDWGRVTLDTAPGFQPFAFAGGLYDAHTTLTRFGARDYDAETGRWTTKDPIRFEGDDTNLYGYVVNDPVNWIDPGGEVLAGGGFWGWFGRGFGRGGPGLGGARGAGRGLGPRGGSKPDWTRPIGPQIPASVKRAKDFPTYLEKETPEQLCKMLGGGGKKARDAQRALKALKDKNRLLPKGKVPHRGFVPPWGPLTDDEFGSGRDPI